MTIRLALAALALGMTTTIASVQTVLNGSFELPAAVDFGDSLLQPGQYSISMGTDVRDLAYVQKIHVSGEGVSKTFLAISKPTPESGRNCLKITRIYDIRGGRIRHRRPRQIILVWHDKNVRKKMLRASAGPSIALPVSTAAGL